jgi:hypothetical protein
MSSHEPRPDCPLTVDAAPYVLGALEDPGCFREHLAECSACSTEVSELQRVADMLPATSPPAVASKALRERVMATVRSEAALMHAAGERADEPERQARAGWLRSRRMPLLTGGAGLAAAAAVIVLIAIGTGAGTHEHVTTGQVASAMPDAHATLRQRGTRADLVVSGMPEPPLGKVYEVWLSRGTGTPQPTDALFSVTSRGSGAVDVPSSLHGVKEVLVTSEPLGGSTRPTSPPVIRVVLAA